MTAPPDIPALRKIAEAATRGPWLARRNEMFPVGFVEGAPVEGMPYRAEILGDDYTGFGDDEQHARDVDYIATFDPPTVLALLDRLEAAEADNLALCASESTVVARQLIEARDENAQLRAAIEEMRRER